MKLPETLELWLARFDDCAIRMRDQLEPPAGEERIAAAENIFGKKFPDDVRHLYLLANGQKSPYKTTYYTDKPNLIELPFDLNPNESVGNLFGGYEFLSLDKALEQWKQHESILKDYNDHDFITVREGDHVLAHSLNNSWWPLAMDGGGNFYGVDMAPTEGGAVGQIILFGPDEDQRKVLGSSITDLFLRLSITPITADEIHDQRYWFSINE